MYNDTNKKCILKLSFITFLSILAISGCNREANLISDSNVPEVVEKEMKSNQMNNGFPTKPEKNKFSK